MEHNSENLREKFEKKVLDWPHVIEKKMFGHPCYQAEGKLFAFIVPNGIVLTKLPQNERENIPEEYKTTSYKSGKRIIKHWVQFSIYNSKDLKFIVPYIRKSYESILNSE